MTLYIERESIIQCVLKRNRSYQRCDPQYQRHITWCLDTSCLTSQAIGHLMVGYLRLQWCDPSQARYLYQEVRKIHKYQTLWARHIAFRHVYLYHRVLPWKKERKPQRPVRWSSLPPDQKEEREDLLEVQQVQISSDPRTRYLPDCEVGEVWRGHPTNRRWLR